MGNYSFAFAGMGIYLTERNDYENGIPHCLRRRFFDGIDNALKYGFDFVQFDLGVPAYFLNVSSDDKTAEIGRLLGKSPT